jgi:hypothetical protein
MSSYQKVLSNPDYRRDLGDGLMLRWSTAADQQALADLYGFVYRETPELPINTMTQAFCGDLVSGRHPLSGPHEFALVEDTRNGQVVSATALMTMPLNFYGLPLTMGRPEIVATLPDYRSRGFVRAIFELIHARSAYNGHLLQGITGIGHFYRQFDYEYALDLGGGRQLPFTGIKPLPEGETEAYTIRPATLADLPVIARLYDRERARAGFNTVIDEAFWHWTLVGNSPESGEGWTPQMIVNREGRAVGYALPRRLRWGDRMGISGLMVEPDVSLAAVLPGTLRGLKAYAEQAGGWVSSKNPPPANSLYFQLGAAHPLYEVLGPNRFSRIWPAYAWYIRVPNLAGFIHIIRPVLNQRLANSAFANYSGELRLDFYRSGLKLSFDQGTLKNVAPWRSQIWGEEGQAAFTGLTFLQLLFGYRSLNELKYAFADVWSEDEAGALLDALFPRLPSAVISLD